MIKAAEGGVCAAKGFTANGVLCGIKNNIIKVVQLVSSIASLIMFIIIMIVAVTTHPTY